MPRDFYNLTEQQLVYAVQADSWMGTTGTNVTTIEAKFRQGPRSFYDHELPAVLLKVLGKPRQAASTFYSDDRFYRFVAYVLHRGGDLDAIVDSVQNIVSALEDLLESQTDSSNDLKGLGTNANLWGGPFVEMSEAVIKYSEDADASFTVLATMEGTVEIIPA
jgi:hypothetical protein